MLLGPQFLPLPMVVRNFDMTAGQESPKRLERLVPRDTVPRRDFGALTSHDQFV